MNEHAQPDRQERRLWRQYVVGSGSRASEGPLDPNLLAAYLDGTADPEDVERVEAAMASDPAVLEEVMELRGLAGAESQGVPAWLLARAKAVVPAAQGAAAQRRLAVWYQPRSLLRGLRWAAAAAALILACAGGFGAGLDTHANQAEAAQPAPAPKMGLEELMSEPTLGMIADPVGRNGGGS